jgi:uncharacterized protein with von Willebrand factor type A (vWA) domain
MSNVKRILREKENKAKEKKRKQKKIKAKANKEKRRYFVNPTCIKCGREYHIQISSKEAWKDVDLNNYVCIICSDNKKVNI